MNGYVVRRRGLTEVVPPGTPAEVSFHIIYAAVHCAYLVASAGAVVHHLYLAGKALGPVLRRGRR